MEEKSNSNSSNSSHNRQQNDRVPEIESIILQNLVHNEEYVRSVLPYLRKEYFQESKGIIFDSIIKFVVKYNKLPNWDALYIELGKSDEVSELNANSVEHDLFALKEPPDKRAIEWLIDSTEEWIQDRALYLAVIESINIIDGKHPTLTKTALPTILSDALAVSFSNSVGHDYLEDSGNRYDFYHRSEERIPFDIDYFNFITGGGLMDKLMMLFLAPTGVGKTLVMTHLATSFLQQGKNVMFITLEMSEERIAERIDANLFDIPIDQLGELSRKVFDKKIDRLRNRGLGKLLIKEYPTASAHVGHFRALLNEAKLKRNFVPDVLFIDYLGICASSRMKAIGGAVNSYAFLKAIAEEVRGLAVEYSLPVISAVQSNRSGFNNSDIDSTNTSDSIGIAATTDLYLAIVSDEALDKLGQIMFKQLKNRHHDPSKPRKFLVGIDRPKMRLYNLEQSAQSLIQDDGTQAVPSVGSSSSGGNSSRPSNGFGKPSKLKGFSGFKE